MTFTSKAAEMNWIGKRVALLSNKASDAIMSGSSAKAREIGRQSDALVSRYIELGGTHYDLAGFC